MAQHCFIVRKCYENQVFAYVLYIDLFKNQNGESYQIFNSLKITKTSPFHVKNRKIITFSKTKEIKSGNVFRISANFFSAWFSGRQLALYLLLYSICFNHISHSLWKIPPYISERMKATKEGN